MIKSIFNFSRFMLDLIYIENNYIAADKQRHFISGAVLSALFFLGIGFYSIPIVSFLAICKEVWDYFHRDIHTPDVWDWIATTSGGIVGAYIINFLII